MFFYYLPHLFDYLHLFQGIDTEKPLLQLDDYTFCGQYSDTLGTNLIFQDTTDVNGKD